MKINRILGLRGRITIPYAIRKKMGFKAYDIISFEEQDNNTVIVRREKLCCNCKEEKPSTMDKPTDETTLLEFIDGLSKSEQRAALVHLIVKWADFKKGDINV